MFRIIDLDNCISDDGWRRSWIKPDHSVPRLRFHEYHQLAPWDEFRNYHLTETNTASLIICTSRPVEYQALTVVWLRRNGIRYKHLLMRNDNDFRSSVDVKRQQVQWLFDHYDVGIEEIASAWDDREDVLKMYSGLGIPAFKLAIEERG